MPVEAGKIVEGKVTGITNFGAFVQLEEGKTGLVHISEVAVGYVKDIKKYLKENQIVKVKIISIDEKGRINLSIKKALEEEKAARKYIVPDDIDWFRKDNNENLSFEDKLLKFKQDSDERMQDLKRSLESKRSGGYRRSSSIYVK